MLNIVAFCDASLSVRTKRAATCSIILSDNTFHGIVTKSHTRIDTTARAELLGIIQTVEFIKTLEDVGTVTILCDCKSNVNLYNKLLQNCTLSESMSYYEDWVKLMELSEGMNITARYVPGHAEELSCNIVCDTVARNVLKWENT